MATEWILPWRIAQAPAAVDESPKGVHTTTGGQRATVLASGWLYPTLRRQSPVIDSSTAIVHAMRHFCG